MSLRILIVDDSPIIRAMIQKNIKLAEIPPSECLQAGNGQEAFDLLEEQWIDLVIADINMPVMNGLELIQKMKAEPVMKTIPVVVASTEGSKTRIDELQQLGISGYLRKPFTPEQFKEQISNILEQNHAA